MSIVPSTTTGITWYDNGSAPEWHSAVKPWNPSTASTSMALETIRNNWSTTISVSARRWSPRCSKPIACYFRRLACLSGNLFTPSKKPPWMTKSSSYRWNSRQARAAGTCHRVIPQKVYKQFRYILADGGDRLWCHERCDRCYTLQIPLLFAQHFKVATSLPTRWAKATLSWPSFMPVSSWIGLAIRKKAYMFDVRSWILHLADL